MRRPSGFVRPGIRPVAALVLTACCCAGCDSAEPPAAAAAHPDPAAAAAAAWPEPDLTLPPAEPELRLPTAGPLPANPGALPDVAAYTRAVRRGGSAGQPAEVELIGLELAFDPTDPGARLNAFHERPGLASLTLKADTVRIAGRLWLPQTDLTIIARRLVFEDPAGADQPARIDTTPLPHGPPPRDAHEKSPGRPGAHGGSAGNLTLIVDELLPVPAVPEPARPDPGAAADAATAAVPPPPVHPRGERDAQRQALEQMVAQGRIDKQGYVERTGQIEREYREREAAYREALATYRSEHLQQRIAAAQRAREAGAIDQARYTELMPAIEAGLPEPPAPPPEPPRAPLRFVLDGQSGQAGGKGLDGQPGRDAPYVGHWKGLGKTADQVFRNVVHFEKTWFAGNETLGGAVPTNGSDAVSGGRPGNGGRAGNLLTNLPLDLVALAVSQQGGAAGPTTRAHYGGREGWPSTWRHIKSDGINLWLVKDGKTTQGEGKPSRTAEPGAAGELQAVSDAAWLTPGLVDLRAELARDAYLNGHHELARQVCIDHLRAAARQPQVREDPRTAPAHRDLLTLARRLRSGLDYFGNPPGWAPMLSLETTIDTYRAGIDDSVRLLAVTAWAHRNWDDLAGRRRSLDTAIALQRRRIEHHLRAHADARQVLPRLRSELNQAERDQQRFIGQLEAKERQLGEQFKHDEEKRKLATDTIAAIKSGIEIAAFTGTGGGAAAVGMGGLTFVESQLAPKPPGPDANSTTAALNGLLAADDQAAARERFLAMGIGDAAELDAFVAELQDLSGVLAEATRQEIAAKVSAGVDSEAGARLEALKNEDPDFARYFNQVVELATLRKMLTVKVAEAMERLDRHADAVADAREAIAALAAARDTADALIDEPARKALATMDREARERLMLYKYYVVKAWEYRMLRPAAVDYRENRLFDRLAALVGADDAWTYADESAMYRDLKAVYESDLNGLISALVRDLAERRTEAVRTERRLTLRPQELQRLNSLGVVEIPLDPRVVLPSDRNSRLARVAVEPGGTRIAGGGPETYLEVTFEPADWSVLHWSDDAYLFRYGLKREANLVRWGFSWHAGGDMTPFDSTGEHAAMLAAAGSRAERMRFRPGARTRLVVRRELHPAGATATIDALTMVLTVDKHKARSGTGSR